MLKNFYDVLWVSKSATQEEIKKAYRKKAMEHHPDRNKWNADAEKKFKEINEAYDTLWDDKKRKNYDMFWSNWNFWWGNPFGGWSYQSGWVDFEDIFSQFWWWSRNSSYSQSFDFWDLFWNFWWQKTKTQEKQKQESPDIEKTYVIPVFDLILWCKIEVTGFLWQTAKLKIPENTKPGCKFRVKEFGKNIWGKKWNLIVTVDVKMPKHISDIDKKLLESMRENIGY